MKRWCNIPYLVRHFKTWKAVASALTLMLYFRVLGPRTVERSLESLIQHRLQGKPISNVSASSRRSFRRGVIRYLAAGALVCAAVGVNAPHLLLSDVPLGHDRHVIGTFEESKDKMLEVLKTLLPGLNKVRCWSGPTIA